MKQRSLTILQKCMPLEEVSKDDRHSNDLRFFGFKNMSVRNGKNLSNNTSTPLKFPQGDNQKIKDFS